ncbi:DUF3006 family protein [Salisediminibacterium beveridgei]|uniref:DUF3006 domain-containing protein n=1 Tax=Salisediminibacterium beveridgei TaxID=632773 RepID=A0A1D7QU29_9BACI|nr:DUF3006 family protein [Salisediminibacterium beveridgei]AOM82526.1 hypothetical protein BBEV_1158 [Salisediminibacterium beveridgei]
MKKKAVIDRVEDGIIVLLFEEDGREEHLQADDWLNDSLTAGNIVEVTLNNDKRIEHMHPLHKETSSRFKRVADKRKRLAGRSPGSRFKKK